MRFQGVPPLELELPPMKYTSRHPSLGSFMITQSRGSASFSPGRSVANAGNEILVQESTNTMSAYLGDRVLNENAFLVALQGRVLRVLLPYEARETASHLWIRPPDQLLEFLNCWMERVRL